MSIIDRVVSGVKDVMLLRADVSRIAAEQIELEADVRDHEKRLIRIETIVEFTDRRALPRQLPDQ